MELCHVGTATCDFLTLDVWLQWSRSWILILMNLNANSHVWPLATPLTTQSWILCLWFLQPLSSWAFLALCHHFNKKSSVLPLLLLWMTLWLSHTTLWIWGIFLLMMISRLGSAANDRKHDISNLRESWFLSHMKSFRGNWSWVRTDAHLPADQPLPSFLILLPSLHLSIHPLLLIHPTNTNPSVHWSIHLSVCLSVRPPTSLKTLLCFLSTRHSLLQLQ